MSDQFRMAMVNARSRIEALWQTSVGDLCYDKAAAFADALSIIQEEFEGSLAKSMSETSQDPRPRARLES